jgi:hypothetical protein
VSFETVNFPLPAAVSQTKNAVRNTLPRKDGMRNWNSSAMRPFRSSQKTNKRKDKAKNLIKNVKLAGIALLRAPTLPNSNHAAAITAKGMR